MEDIIQQQFDLNCSGYAQNLLQALFVPLLGTFGAFIIRTVVNPRLLASINPDRIASELKGQMSVEQICDFMISAIEF